MTGVVVSSTYSNSGAGWVRQSGTAIPPARQIAHWTRT